MYVTSLSEVPEAPRRHQVDHNLKCSLTRLSGHGSSVTYDTELGDNTAYA